MAHVRKTKQLPSKKYWWDAAVAVVAVALVGYGVYTAFGGGKDKQACAARGSEHELTLQNDSFSVGKLRLTQCDTLKIVNLDTQPYNLAFGVHDRHIAYPGYSEQLVRPHEFIVVDALQAGEYIMHDHLRDNARVELSVAAK